MYFWGKTLLIGKTEQWIRCYWMKLEDKKFFQDGQDSDDPKQSTADMTAFEMGLPHNLRLMHRFSIPVVYAVRYKISFSRCRIDELEQSINDLRTEMGVEGSPSSSGAPRPKPEESKSPVDSA
ncbi:hypothetical protein CK203_115511 [Vitis vinifera]|uniref:Uncharacterized protein n=1 Tax=Vitis vinifera TaxID=29760 RepID=A0A438F7J6_VITVI|nr:hypothetical protein CK203_115511 [Vitis vinifera]